VAQALYCYAIGPSSTKRCLSPFGRVILSDLAETENLQPSIENERINLSEAHILTYLLPASTNAISARISRECVKSAEDGPGNIVHLRGIWKLLQLSNFASASSDELMFVSCVATLGPKTAVALAAKHTWKCQRPLVALLATIHESGRNYSARSAKRGGRSISARRKSRSGRALSSRMGSLK
jgi:hypothetical protein